MNIVLNSIKKYQKYILFFIIVFAIFIPYIFKNQIFDAQNNYKKESQNINNQNSASQEEQSKNEYSDFIEINNLSDKNLYKVVNVVDGDTIDVIVSNKTERIRMIGINTPETVDPRKTVECFGKEASDRTKEILLGNSVYLESDLTQQDRDKYSRLLRYVYLSDGTNFNLWLIKNGYAYEYTYNVPYKYQNDFKNAQKDATNNQQGLWAAGVCSDDKEGSENLCNIKGNVNSAGAKIYHILGQKYYNETVIDESKGEKWFCSEDEAQKEGWRKSQV